MQFLKIDANFEVNIAKNRQITKLIDNEVKICKNHKKIKLWENLQNVSVLQFFIKLATFLTILGQIFVFDQNLSISTILIKNDNGL